MGAELLAEALRAGAARGGAAQLALLAAQRAAAPSVVMAWSLGFACFAAIVRSASCRASTPSSRRDPARRGAQVAPPG
jgi:hypothetical protein